MNPPCEPSAATRETDAGPGTGEGGGGFGDEADVGTGGVEDAEAVVEDDAESGEAESDAVDPPFAAPAELVGTAVLEQAPVTTARSTRPSHRVSFIRLGRDPSRRGSPAGEYSELESLDGRPVHREHPICRFGVSVSYAAAVTCV